MQQVADAFGKTLAKVEAALRQSFSAPGVEPRWGIAGFREESLVYMLAETMRAQGWTCAYEHSYDDGTRRRVDLVATMLKEKPLWIEAKWWWFNVGIGVVLSADRAKLKAARAAHRPIAAVFTVDEKDVTVRGQPWTVETAKTSIADDVPPGWKLVGCCSLESRYSGTSLRDPRHVADREGVFAAAFFELVP
jgi:hypothetical protein